MGMALDYSNMSRAYVDPMPPSTRSGRHAALPWVVVGALWVTLAIASGLYFSFPIFFVALVEEFGWSRGATAAAFSISSVVQGMLSPVVGMLGCTGRIPRTPSWAVALFQQG